MRTREKVIGYRIIRISRNVIRKLLCIGCSCECCVLQLNKHLSDLYCHLMHTKWWRYSSLYVPKVRIRNMIEFLWLQNASRESVKTLGLSFCLFWSWDPLGPHWMVLGFLHFHLFPFTVFLATFMGNDSN